MKFYGHQSVLGTMTIGISAEQYEMPESALNNQPGYTIIDVDGTGKLVFGDISPYINLQNVPGGDTILQNINNLLQILNNIASNNIVSFHTLIDVQPGITGNPGEILIMDENSNNPLQVQKVKASGLKLSDLNTTLSNLQSEINIIKNTPYGTQGRLPLNTTSKIYTINHSNIDPNIDFPVVSLEIPNSGSHIFIQGIFNRQATSFQVEISNYPPTNGYYLIWHINSTKSLYDNYDIFYVTTNNSIIPPYTNAVVIPNTVTTHYDIYLPLSPIKGKEFKIINYSTFNMYIKTSVPQKINYHTLTHYILYPGKHISCIWTDTNDLGWMLLSY